MFADQRRINYRKSSLIYLFILLVGSFDKVFTGITDSGIPRDLAASVLEDTTFSAGDEGHGPLKLNITWRAPLNSSKPSSYSVLITSVSKSDNVDANLCPEETLFHTIWDKNRRFVVLPENQFLSEAPELSIRPTCSYSIQVFANPRNNPNLKVPEIILTVPECVGRWCDCRRAEEYLPIPQVAIVSQSSRDIFIEWKTRSAEPRVHSYVISFGTPFLISNNRLPVYNISKIADVSSAVSSYLWSTNDTDLDVASGGKVYVTAKDSAGCLGSPGTALMEFSIDAAASIHRSGYRLVWISLAGILMLVLTATSSFLYIRRRRNDRSLWRNRSTPRIPGLIRLSKLRSQWADSTLRERNALYVEHEIEVARKHGQADDYEVSYKRLKFIRELGKGQFGKVYLGKLEGHRASAVAIKMSNSSDPSAEPEARRQLLDEIETMKIAGPHPHLVRLLATCTLPGGPICVILEYLEGGDLLAHLHRIRDCISCNETLDSGFSSTQSQRPSLSETVYTTLENQSPLLGIFADYPAKSLDIESPEENGAIYVNAGDDDARDVFGDFSDLDRDRFTSFALDIARGMEHLESRGIIHRDLAARNILLSTDMTLKISDFGLSRNDGVYVIGNGEGGVRRLPVRWMAPEALRDRAFTSKSDVWSFAIVLWEIGTLGAFPYSDIEDDQLLRHVLRDEGRLRKPENVSLELYNIMQSCWSSRADNRPNFGQIVHRLLGLGEPSQFFIATSNPCYTLLSTLATENNAVD